MKLQYNRSYDTLTVTLDEARHVICWEDPKGVLYRYDPVKRTLLGFTILGVSHRSHFDLSEYLEVGAKQLLWHRIAEAEGKASPLVEDR